MINILAPMAGGSTFKVSGQVTFPKLLASISGRLLVERGIAPFLELTGEKRIVTVIPKEQISQYNLDKVFNLVDEDIKIFPLHGATQGAACSALLALEELDLNAPLIITTFEQILDFDINSCIDCFVENEVSAGVLTFEDIHPKWSYVRVNDDGYVLEAAEKRPISKRAVAGFYYFKSAQIFVDAAKEMILNSDMYKGTFYISHTLNYIVLSGGKVLSKPIQKDRYHHFHDEHSLDEYEHSDYHSSKIISDSIRSKTLDYVNAFNDKDEVGVSKLLADDVKLKDPDVDLNGKDDVLNFVKSIFKTTESLSFKEKNIFIEDNVSVIEFELNIDDVFLVGIDVIVWDHQNKISELRAYLYEKK